MGSDAATPSNGGLIIIKYLVRFIRDADDMIVRLQIAVGTLVHANGRTIRTPSPPSRTASAPSAPFSRCCYCYRSVNDSARSYSEFRSSRQALECRQCWFRGSLAGRPPHQRALPPPLAPNHE